MAHVLSRDEDDGSEQQKQLLMGSGPSQMNLNNVRHRASDLRSTLAEMMASMRANAHRLVFDDVLDKFSVVSRECSLLQRQLRPQHLADVVAHPAKVDGADGELIPEQLATMLLPDMERERAAILADADAAPPVPGARHADLAAALVKHNSLIDAALTKAECGDDKSRKRKVGPVRRWFAGGSSVREANKSFEASLAFRLDYYKAVAQKREDEELGKPSGAKKPRALPPKFESEGRDGRGRGEGAGARHVTVSKCPACHSGYSLLEPTCAACAAVDSCALCASVAQGVCQSHSKLCASTDKSLQCPCTGCGAAYKCVACVARLAVERVALSHQLGVWVSGS